MPLISRDSNGFERVVYAEVLIPDVPTAFGDVHTVESIKNFAYGFAKSGYEVDIEHAKETAEDKFTIVESFIAREYDTDFVPNSWVVGALITDDELWQEVIDGTINGFSYQALVKFTEIEMEVPEFQTITGATEPDLIDRHVHDYIVVLDSDFKPIYGGTSESNGHTHSISKAVSTDSKFNHTHRYNFIDQIPKETT